jgi:hypothetical protein
MSKEEVCYKYAVFTIQVCLVIISVKAKSRKLWKKRQCGTTMNKGNRLNISYYMRARFPVLREESTCWADWAMRLC